MSPEAPRVSDIIAEAGVSNKAFYRYFAMFSDDLMLAAMERGVALVVSYRAPDGHEKTPQDKVARWIRGALAQVVDPELTAMSRALVIQLTGPDKSRVAQEEIVGRMRALLIEPIGQLGRPTRSATPTRCSTAPSA